MCHKWSHTNFSPLMLCDIYKPAALLQLKIAATAVMKISCWLLVGREEVMQENAHNVAGLND